MCFCQYVFCTTYKSLYCVTFLHFAHIFCYSKPGSCSEILNDRRGDVDCCIDAVQQWRMIDCPDLCEFLELHIVPLKSSAAGSSGTGIIQD